MKDEFKPYRPELAFAPISADSPNPQPDQEAETPFIPPEMMAKQDEQSPQTSNSTPNQTTPRNDTHKKQRKNPKQWFMSLSKQKKIIYVSALLGLLVAVAGLVWWFVLRSEPAPAPQPVAQQEKEPPKPTTVASRLTGMQVKPELNDLPTTGVMIETSPDARPQSGLQEAGVVYEAIAEGGITRFLALYLEAKPAAIGPVRRNRPPPRRERNPSCPGSPRLPPSRSSSPAAARPVASSRSSLHARRHRAVCVGAVTCGPWRW